MKFSSIIIFILVGPLTISYFFKPNTTQLKSNQSNSLERKKINNNNINSLIKFLRDSDKKLLPEKIIDSEGKISYRYNLIEGEKIKFKRNKIFN